MGLSEDAVAWPAVHTFLLLGYFTSANTICAAAGGVFR